MTESFADRMKTRLLELQAELDAVAETGDASSGVVELDQSRVGRLSRMDAMQAQAMSKASGRRRDIMLQNIQSALARIESDAYGNCQACDLPINVRRLEFDPTALLCIDCASAAER